MKNLRLPPMEASPSLDWNTFFELVSSVLLTSGTPAGLFYYYRPRAEWWELLGVGFLGLLASYLLGYFANRRGSWLSLPRSWSKEVADHGDEGSLVLLGMMALWNLIVGLSTGMYRCLAKMQAQASPERRTQLLQTILALLAEDRQRLLAPEEVWAGVQGRKLSCSRKEVDRSLHFLSRHGLACKSPSSGQFQLNPMVEL